MAESILNYCKSIEILFATSEDSRNDIRRELAKLGFSEEEIEGDFVPLLILRSYVDVAHPKVAIFKRRHLSVLYQFVSQSEETLRELLRLVIAKVADGSYEIPQEEDLTLNKKKHKEMDKLIASMYSRIRYPND